MPFLRGHELAVHVASYVVLGTFLWLNRHLPGMGLLAAGFACNAVAIVANGGLMPASEEALRAAGRWTLMHEAGLTHNNSTVIGPQTKLWFLGDVFALPQGLPLANVFSVGDVLLALGALALVPPLMGARPFEPREATAAAATVGFLLGLLVGTVRVPAALREGAGARNVSSSEATLPPLATQPSPQRSPGPIQPTPTPASGGYTVQVGAFRQRVNAQAMARQLRAQGYDARLVSGPLVRVWIGFFPDELAARRMAQKLVRAGYPSFVRRAPDRVNARAPAPGR